MCCCRAVSRDAARFICFALRAQRDIFEPKMRFGSGFVGGCVRTIGGLVTVIAY